MARLALERHSPSLNTPPQQTDGMGVLLLWDPARIFEPERGGVPAPAGIRAGILGADVGSCGTFSVGSSTRFGGAPTILFSQIFFAHSCAREVLCPDPLFNTLQFGDGFAGGVPAL